MNYCVNFRVRSKKGKKYCFCVRRKAEIERKDCSECNCREFKKIARMTVKTRLKPISKKRVCVSKKTYNEVYERDKGCCRLCNKINIELHHIKYRSEAKDLIDEPSNCIMLCFDCHKLVHSDKKKYQPILLEIVKQTKKTD